MVTRKPEILVSGFRFSAGRILFSFVLFAVSPLLAAQNCPELPIHETVALDRVYDGDTLRLQDGRRVRLLSVNAPELARDDLAAQPWAAAAQRAVEDFFGSQQTVLLSFENRRQDRYGRLLAHVMNQQGQNLEQFLVAQGFAIPIVVPPDDRLAPCLRILANKAQQDQLGLWRDSFWHFVDVNNLSIETEEFRNLCGRVMQVDETATAVWLELNGPLVLSIAKDDLEYFSSQNSRSMLSWRNKIVNVSGWLVDRRENKNLMAQGFKPWSMQVRTSYAFEFVESCK